MLVPVPPNPRMVRPLERSYDVSGIKKVDEIAALLPAAVAERGTFVVGAAIDYPPAEFRAEDLQTAIGYDVDMSKALGRVLGLETGDQRRGVRLTVARHRHQVRCRHLVVHHHQRADGQLQHDLLHQGGLLPRCGPATQRASDPESVRPDHCWGRPALGRRRTSPPSRNSARPTGSRPSTCLATAHRPTSPPT